MVHRHIIKAGLVACIAVHGLLGCAAEVESGALEPDDLAPGEVDPGEAEVGDELGLVREGILGGIQTTSFPAVGKLAVGSGVCTATLISSQVILTAAHCFAYNQNISNLGGGTTPPNNNFAAVNAIFTMFNQFPPSGMAQTQTRSVKRVYVVGTSLGASDLAIAQLATEVRADYATPYPIATTTPSQGALVQGVGFGCTTPGGSGGGVNKTYRGAQWQTATRNTIPALGCQGDSGGPIINSSAQIVAVVSGPGANGLDSFAQPVQHRATIDRINAIYGVRQVCTSCPFISFRTWDRTHFLQAPDNGGVNAIINATPTAIGEWEQFRLVQFSRTVPQAIPTWVALQTRSGRFVSTVGNGVGNVKVTNEIFNNELFYMEPRSGGGRSLRTNHAPQRYYLTAENGGGGTVSSNRTTANVWETLL